MERKTTGLPQKILIVDDEADTVELLRKRLHFEGYHTLEAGDGEECLKQVAEGKPDLIILDVMMPKLDGYEVCRILQKSRSTAYIPVLMLTAKGGTENKVKGLDVGALDYLPKPFEYQELLARIKSLLSMKAARERLVEEEKTKAVDRVMAEITHELRNPLTSIGGFARKVNENLPEGDPNKKYLQMILDDVVRLEKMVRDLVELKTSAISYREFADVNVLIGEVLEQFEKKRALEGIELRTELAASLPLLSIDKEHFQLALGNIIENSIEAMQEMSRKVLSIHSKATYERVEIEVSDSGRGIPKDKIKNIFDPFFTSKISGPGLGLTFALKVIEDHRGTIAVESEPGAGSCVTLRLPITMPAVGP
ncbi:MAG: response regulator [Syntrophobacteraceae bacterium]